MLLHQPHGAFAHFGGKLRLICHDSTLSKLGASAKPRVIQFDYIERFYNTRRQHSIVGYASLMQFEAAAC